MRGDHIEAFWQEYLNILPPDSTVRSESYDAESFGDSPEMADEIGALVANGTKTATCSALWEWESEDEPLPEPGTKCVILDGRDEPLCVIETTEVEIRPYSEVDARFAYEEGEGDRSLQYWRDEHWRFFTRSLAEIGEEPTPEMPLVCERFQIVHS
ncbi:ASCH domain-containing protein [Rubrobacter aplysinae]|uniref:ASCH domain-containing protein n=1 Tax=Rubrobacter aplysinae TaxID=909625 RepID=UPI00069EDDBD|nr:ASCH domain-containing protein [Rubrobacter aplysinae]